MRAVELIKDRIVSFQYYRDGFFVYQLDSGGLQFEVPVNEVVSATLKAQDKAIYFMRWILRAAAQQEKAVTSYVSTGPVDLVEPKFKIEDGMVIA